MAGCLFSRTVICEQSIARLPYDVPILRTHAGSMPCHLSSRARGRLASAPARATSSRNGRSRSAVRSQPRGPAEIVPCPRDLLLRFFQASDQPLEAPAVVLEAVVVLQRIVESALTATLLTSPHVAGRFPALGNSLLQWPPVFSFTSMCKGD